MSVSKKFLKNKSLCKVSFILPPEAVITSYSIHYTKLYEDDVQRLHGHAAHAAKAQCGQRLGRGVYRPAEPGELFAHLHRNNFV